MCFAADGFHVELRVPFSPDKELLDIGVEDMDIGGLVVEVLAARAVGAEALGEELVALLALVVGVDVQLEPHLLLSVGEGTLGLGRGYLAAELAIARQLPVSTNFSLLLFLEI
jgi:hypothetical protein